MSRLLIVALRVLLLLVATGAVVAASAIAIGHRFTPPPGHRYACPMHPEVNAPQPGQCPICHMDLERIARAGTENPMVHSSMRGLEDLTAVENVRKHKIVDFVRMHALLQNTREMRGPAWVEADHTITALFYNDQIWAMLAGEPGDFLPAQSPRNAIAVRRKPDTIVPWDRSTSKIRFAIAPTRNARRGPQPGQVGWLVLPPKARAVLGVPSSAVLQSPEGPYVLAWVGGLKFEKRTIDIGETFLKQGFAVVLSGLGPQDRVVSKATFFVDANRRLAETDNTEAWILE